MTVYRAYQLYLAVKLHFSNPKYNVIESKGHIRVPESALTKKPKVQYQLNKLIRKYGDVGFINYLVANSIAGVSYCGLFDIEQGHEIYLDWQKRQESLSYTYKSELENLLMQVPKLEDLWNCKDGHPILLKAYFAKTCSLETLVILNKLYRFSDVIDEQLVFDPVWGSVSLLLHKYSPFVKFDKEKFVRMTEQAIQ